MKNHNSTKVKERKIMDHKIFDPELKEVINDVISYSWECEINIEDSDEMIDFL